MQTNLAVYLPAPAPVAAHVSDAEASDAELIAMWLHGRPARTVASYRLNVRRFRTFLAEKPLRHVTLGDLQRFSNSLTGAVRSRGQVLSTIKSLLTFCAKLGALRYNVGAALKVEKAPSGLAQRILSEEQVGRMLAFTKGRDHAIVRLLYGSGVRASELVSIRWGDLADDPKTGGAFLTVVGKGDKARTVPVSALTWNLLAVRRGDDPLDARVFPITRTYACRIVRKAARAAGLEQHASTHWLRHANASHALDRGCPIAVVRDSLGHANVATTNMYLHAKPGDGTARYLPV